MYCEKCHDIRLHNRKATDLPPTEHELEVTTEVLAEQIRGETAIQDRIARLGTGECVVCGRPTIPGRLCCSPQCRGCVARKSGIPFEHNGVVDCLRGHLKRSGISVKTYEKRVQRGLTIAQALTIPLHDRKALWAALGVRGRG